MRTDHLCDINVYLSQRITTNGQLDDKIQKDTKLKFSSHSNVKELKLENFKVLKVIGKGRCGKVFLVKYLPTHELYAMKSLKKDILIELEKEQKNNTNNTLLNKEILESIYYPFLCNIVFNFQAEERIYFIMEFLQGGELFQHLKKFRTFDEDKVRFYGAQIALALEYLHKKGVVYGNLRPKNILIDDKGYLRLVGFGFNKQLENEDHQDLNTGFCDFQEYLPPEIIKKGNFSKNADWWSLGILLFEMLCGIPPFYYKNKEIFNEKPVIFPKKINLSDDAKDVIKKLIENDPKKRLGSQNGIEEIKAHPFFANIDFDLIEKKKIPAPYIPELPDDFHEANLDEEFSEEEGINHNIMKKDFKVKLNKFYLY